MRILYIVKTLPFQYKGGIQTHTWKLSQKMLERGHEVSILCGGSLKRGFKKYELEGRSILELPYLPGRKFPFLKKISEEVFFNWAAARWLQTNQNSFDLVHLQGRSGLGIYGFNSRISLPIFHTFHGLISVERKMNTLNEKLSIEDKFHVRIFSSWEKKSLEKSNGIIAVSQKMKSDLRTLNKNLSERASIIPNGIEPFEVEEQDQPNENNLLFVARLEKLKGIYPLLEAMLLVKNDLRLFIIGEGSQKAEMEAFLKENALSDKVFLLGSKNEKEVFAQIQKSRALILPSFHETQGIVLMEANICKKPVLASNIPGINEVVKDGFNGLLFEAGNAKDMAAKIDQLFSDQQLSESLGKNGFQWVQEQFSWDKIADLTELNYQQHLQHA
ncbi:MAG: glycosyltransferase family 4 protein [Saprospiraceae bacterium]